MGVWELGAKRGLWDPKWDPKNSGYLAGTLRKSGSRGRSLADSGPLDDPLEAYVYHSAGVELEPGYAFAGAARELFGSLASAESRTLPSSRAPPRLATTASTLSTRSAGITSSAINFSSGWTTAGESTALRANVKCSALPPKASRPPRTAGNQNDCSSRIAFQSAKSRNRSIGWSKTNSASSAACAEFRRAKARTPSRRIWFKKELIWFNCCQLFARCR